MSISMRVGKFIESPVYKDLDSNVQDLLTNLIEKLGSLDYLINKRDERKQKVLVFKARSSEANIATIRLRQGYITVGPYKMGNENGVRCTCKEDITEKLIMDIKEIYQDKEGTW